MVNGAEKNIPEVRDAFLANLGPQPESRLADHLQIVVLDLAVHDKRNRQAFISDFMAWKLNAASDVPFGRLILLSGIGS
ncbi:hypothetical protein D3C74_487290 [compost metagenome]